MHRTVVIILPVAVIVVSVTMTIITGKAEWLWLLAALVAL